MVNAVAVTLIAACHKLLCAPVARLHVIYLDPDFAPFFQRPAVHLPPTRERFRRAFRVGVG